MTTTKITAAVILAALTLSACGSSSVPLSEAQIAQKHVDHILDDPLSVPATEDMPVSGEATYSGSFAMQSIALPNHSIVGDAVIDVHFGDGLISGGADNFVAVLLVDDVVTESGARDGSATFQGTFADAVGLIEVTGNVEGDPLVGGMLSSFTGADAQNLIGLGAGDIDGHDINLMLNTQQ